MKRVPIQRARDALPRRSAKAIAAAPLHDIVRESVFTRDEHRCLLSARPITGALHRCGNSPLTVHHLRKASQGGRYEESNLVTLCALANSWVEDWPASAHDLGLVCRRGDTIEECWARMRANGLVP